MWLGMQGGSDRGVAGVRTHWVGLCSLVSVDASLSPSWCPRDHALGLVVRVARPPLTRSRQSR